MIPELRTLIAVVRYGGFSAAGERIGLTQSAVSSQIQRLEESIGLKLFDRTRRSAVLNDSGVRVLARAEEIVALYAKLGDVETDEEAVSLLRIGAIASVQSTVLPRALAALRGSYPSLRVNIVPGVSLDFMDQLDSGHIEAAVMIRPPFGILPDMVWKTLLSEPFKLLVSDQVKGKDWRLIMGSHPFLRYERTSFGGRLVTKFLRDNGVVATDAIELDEISGLIHLVAKGLGVALVPLSDAYLPLPSGVRAISLGEKIFYREIGILRKKVIQHHMVREFEKCVCGAFIADGSRTACSK